MCNISSIGGGSISETAKPLKRLDIVSKGWAIGVIS